MYSTQIYADARRSIYGYTFVLELTHSQGPLLPLFHIDQLVDMYARCDRSMGDMRRRPLPLTQ